MENTADDSSWQIDACRARVDDVELGLEPQAERQALQASETNGTHVGSKTMHIASNRPAKELILPMLSRQHQDVQASLPVTL